MHFHSTAKHMTIKTIACWIAVVASPIMCDIALIISCPNSQRSVITKTLYLINRFLFQCLSQYIFINKEISRKRAEFGLDTLEMGETLASRAEAAAAGTTEE